MTVSRAFLSKRIRELIAECDRTAEALHDRERAFENLLKYKEALSERNHELFRHNKALTKLLQTELEMRSPTKEE